MSTILSFRIGRIHRKTPEKAGRLRRPQIGGSIGFWKDLSQALASYSREVLRTEIGDISVKALSRDLRTLRQAIERVGERCVSLWGKGS